MQGKGTYFYLFIYLFIYFVLSAIEEVKQGIYSTGGHSNKQEKEGGRVDRYTQKRRNIEHVK